MKIPLTITKEGLQALVDAQAGATNAVRIAEIGLSSTPFVTAPTLTALPGEFKRLVGVSGEGAAENIIHLTAQDDEPEGYDVTGVGVFLDNGVLFGVYSQLAEQGPLFGKSVATTFLFAADIAFEADYAALIEFGDANFTYPPATRIRKGVAYLATPEDVAAGLDDEKIVTPALLAGGYVPLAQKGAADGVVPLGPNSKIAPQFLPALDSIDTFTVASEAEMLALPATRGDFARRTDVEMTFQLADLPATDVGNWLEFLSPGAPVRTVNGKIGDVVLNPADVGAPPVARFVNAIGPLLKGGGDLSADRTMTVEIASAAETLAGLINDKAVTPASLVSVLASLAGKAPSSRQVLGGGLVTGGGPLTGDVTLTVPKATAADVEGLVDDSKAVTVAALAGTLRSIQPTGFLRIPGTPLLVQWGSGAFIGGQNPARTFAFPYAFPSACWHVFVTHYSDPDDGDEGDETMFVKTRTAASFTYACEFNDTKNFSLGFLAIGI